MTSSKFTQWKEFNEQAKRDLSASFLLYRDNDYGNAAYHMQQALEKQVKSVIIKMGADKYLNLTNLGHYPLPSIINEAAKAFDVIFEQYSKNTFVISLCMMLKRFKQFGEFFKIFKKNEYKITLWKDSLNIKITENENNKFNKELNAFISQLNMGDFSNVVKPQNYDKTKIITAVAIMEVIRLSTKLLLYTFPHESIGRYPIAINNISSVLLYNKHHKDLEQLLKQV